MFHPDQKASDDIRTGDVVPVLPSVSTLAAPETASGRQAATVWWPGSPNGDRLTPYQSPVIRPTELAPLFRTELPQNVGQVARANDFQYIARLALAPDELERIIELRQESYERHGRNFESKPDKEDFDPLSAILVVRDKDDEIFATMRVSFNLSPSTGTLCKYPLTPEFRNARTASFERLAIRGGGLRAARAKQALFKTAFLMALGVGTDWIVIGTFTPLHRLFQSLGFINVHGPERQIFVDWYGGELHILALRSNDEGRALLLANRVWYDHIMTPDPYVDQTLRAYFESRFPGRAAHWSAMSVRSRSDSSAADPAGLADLPAIPNLSH